MRLFASALLLALVCVFLPACASQDEAARKEQEAGGALPWNRPAQWEGPGVLGSQLNQAQGGGSTGPF